MDQDTYEACKSSVTVSFEKLDPIKVKGKVNPIPVYIPKKKKKADLAITSKSSSTLFGRENEIKLVQKYVKKHQMQMRFDKVHFCLKLIFETKCFRAWTSLSNY